MKEKSRKLTRLGWIAAAVGLSLVPLSAQETGYIKARGKPGHAAIFVNGKYVGPSERFTVPEKYQVQTGDLEVTFRDPRYEDYTTKVTVKPNKTTKIHFALKKMEEPKPPFGRLRLGGGEPESFMSVTAGDVGAIFLNDRFMGYVDELNNIGGGLLIKPGTYDLHVSSPRFGEIRRQVTVEANKVTVIPLENKEK